VAPLILPPECYPAEKVYSLCFEMSGVTMLNTTATSAFIQDMVKFTKCQIHSNATHTVAVPLDHSYAGDLDAVLRVDEKIPSLAIWPFLGDGGNIMATPPLGPHAPYGKIMLGTKNQLSAPQWARQGLQPEILTIDTSWLLVGHVDEIFMWITTNTVLYADPWMATDILHTEIAAGRQADKLWFGLDSNGTNATISQVVIATNQAGYKLASLPAPGLPATTNHATLVFSGNLFSTGDVLRVGSEILLVISTNGASVTVARAQAGRPATAHSPGSVIYAYSTGIQENLPVGSHGESVVEHIAAASNQLRQALGAYPTTFVPMPVLFGKGTGSDNFVAYSANVVNCLVGMDSAIHYSYTGCSAFENYVKQTLPGAKEWNFWVFHCAQGEIHCATAAIRSVPPQPPWWNLNNSWE